MTYMANSEQLIESKTTTQRAPLERLLTTLRTNRIKPYIIGQNVLDFGCGAYLRTLRAVSPDGRQRIGIDSVFKNQPPHMTVDQITVVGSFSDLNGYLDSQNKKIDCIISLACFEHFETNDLRLVLKELAAVSTPNVTLIGTVPTPPAKPVLEFLSYKLGLIDRSQIEDHRVYYDKETLSDALKDTGWILVEYKTFQFGMNSFFRFSKTNS
jgi:SAM-dependent methyltransferase